MHVVIYAAGRATRLGRAYAGEPKILLPFGGKSLLAWHVSHLAALGLERITVVTGHQHEYVEANLPDLRRRYGVDVRECFNPDFNEGSVISLLTSLPEIETSTDGVILMDGDVLYHRAMLERLRGSPHPTALLVDRAYSTIDDDPVLVPVSGGRPFEFQKRWAGEADWVGESIGFFKIAPGDVPLVAAETRSRSQGLSRLDSYDEVIRVLVKAGRFGLEDVTGIPWTEIDFPHDVTYARSKVLPALIDEVPEVAKPPAQREGGETESRP